jgi:hypothetical protein
MMWTRAIAGVLLVAIRGTLALWREEHSVKGLPVIDRSELTSFAGAVPVRKDHEHNIEVPFRITYALAYAVEWSVLLVIRSRGAKAGTSSVSPLDTRWSWSFKRHRLIP